jgi:hypothetical protein
MDIPIVVGCRKCASTDISISGKSRDAIVICNSCSSSLGKLTDIRAEALAELKTLIKANFTWF